MAKVNIEISTKETGKDADALAKKYAAFSAEMTKRTQAFNAVQKQKAAALAEARRAEEAATAAQQRNKLSLTELNSAVQLAAQGLRALKQAYDFGREGASLDFTAAKFDRLAKKIGSTGDALLGKMETATRGTLSKFEAMAAATDILSLGLTKTEKDTIRLATVQAGLAMDTNQLVLALSNQTTMRFDQLGVSVAGFEDKVKSLEAAGYSAQDAFTEAFLQQAEEQLIKVGHAADEALGSFMKFEAQVKNLKDESQMLAADALLPVVEGMNNWFTSLNQVRALLRDTNGEIYQQYLTGHINAAQVRELAAEHAKMGDVLKVSADRYDEMNRMVEANTTVMQMSEEEIKANSDRNQQFLGVLDNVGNALEKYRDGIAASKQQLDEGKITVDQHKAKVAELGAQYEQESAKIVQSIVAMKFATDGWTDAELTAYLNISQGLGVMTAEQVIATQQALATADALVAQAEPILHVGNLAEKSAVQMGVFESAQAALAQGIATGALPMVGGLKSQLQSMPPSGSSWNYYFNIHVKGRIPAGLAQVGGGTGIGGTTGQDIAATYLATQAAQNAEPLPSEASGGPVYAGQPAWVGERGAEPFVPAVNGRILSHAEALRVMASAGGGTGGTSYGPFYGPVSITVGEDGLTGIMGVR